MPDGPHANHGLFSDSYLRRHVPELSGGELAALAAHAAAHGPGRQARAAPG